MAIIALPTVKPLQFTSFPDSLKSPVGRLSLNPVVQNILKLVGQVSIEIADCKEHKAEWSWKERTIKVDSQLLEDTEANKIASIVFELCNALQTRGFKQIIEDASTVDDFVHDMERLEYNSALWTRAIVPQIVGEDIDFDFKHVSPEFTHHYALNQISGHSEWIAKAYFPTQSYRGTLHHSLSELDQTARDLLYNLLYFKSTESGIQMNGGSGPIGFRDIVTALQLNSQSNATYQKVLNCARDLFPEIDGFRVDSLPSGSAVLA